MAGGDATSNEARGPASTCPRFSTARNLFSELWLDHGQRADYRPGIEIIGIRMKRRADISFRRSFIEFLCAPATSNFFLIS